MKTLKKKRKKMMESMMKNSSKASKPQILTDANSRRVPARVTRNKTKKMRRIRKILTNNYELTVCLFSYL